MDRSYNDSQQSNNNYDWITIVILICIGAWWYYRTNNRKDIYNNNDPIQLEQIRRKRAEAAAARFGGVSKQTQTQKQKQQSSSKLDNQMVSSDIPSTITQLQQQQQQQQEQQRSASDNNDERNNKEQKQKYNNNYNKNESQKTLKQLTSSNKEEEEVAVVKVETKKTKKRKNKIKEQPPTIQILCEALSSLFDIPITVESVPETSMIETMSSLSSTATTTRTALLSWGGIGWWKQQQIQQKTQLSSSKTIKTIKTIHLPLYKYLPSKIESAAATTMMMTSEEQERKSLEHHQEEQEEEQQQEHHIIILMDHLTKTLGRLIPKYINIPSITCANIWYHKADSICTVGYAPYLKLSTQVTASTTEGKLLQYFDKNCIRPIQNWIVQQVVTWIHQTIMEQTTSSLQFISDNNNNNNKSSLEENDLFSDDYDQSIISPTNDSNKNKNDNKITIMKKHLEMYQKTYLELLLLFCRSGKTIQQALLFHNNNNYNLLNNMTISSSSSILSSTFLQSIIKQYDDNILSTTSTEKKKTKTTTAVAATEETIQATILSSDIPSTTLTYRLLTDCWYMLQNNSVTTTAEKIPSSISTISQYNNMFSLETAQDQLTVISHWITNHTKRTAARVVDPMVLLNQLRFELSFLLNDIGSSSSSSRGSKYSDSDVQQKITTTTLRQLEENYIIAWRPIWCLVAFPLTDLEVSSLAKLVSYSRRNNNNNSNNNSNKRTSNNNICLGAWSQHVFQQLKDILSHHHHHLHNTKVATIKNKNNDSEEAKMYLRLFYHDPSIWGPLIASCRPIMSLASTLGQSLLKLVATQDKQIVFSWVEAVVEKNEPIIYLAKSDLLSTTIDNSDSDGSVATATRSDNDAATSLNNSNRDCGSSPHDCSTRSFMLGLTATWIDFCCQSLIDRYTSKGISAFDKTYLSSSSTVIKIFSDRFIDVNDSNKKQQLQQQQPTTFSGSTQFFFLTCSLLHVGLHPILRMENEFYSYYRTTFEMCREQANRLKQEQDVTLSSQVLINTVRPIATTMVAFKVFLEDPDFMTNVTNFSLLQLEWLLKTCSSTATTQDFGSEQKSNDSGIALSKALIPDWMFKDPSRWLTHIARIAPHVLKPHHAAKAVELSTNLLQLGEETAISDSTTSTSSSSSPKITNAFASPIVVTCLLRIASAFVDAGIRRARQKKRHRRNRGVKSQFDKTENEEQDDDFYIYSEDQYLSFDQNDLGVTVFTNHLVCTSLCPTLIRIFSTLDVVEGLDMDREFDFDKFSVKLEIADLLLRLWHHPNGECRASIVAKLQQSNEKQNNKYLDNSKSQQYDNEEAQILCSFASSLSTAVLVFFDDAIQKLSTIFTTMKQERKKHQERRQQGAHFMTFASAADRDFNRRFIDSTSSHAAGGLLGARRLLLLLSTLSEENKIASIFGSGVYLNGPGCKKSTSLRDLANMVVHFIDIMTDENGGTHPDLEMMNLSESTFSMAERMTQAVLSTEQKEFIQKVLEGRRYTRVEIGLDISVVCHQLLALVARWHQAAATKLSQQQFPSSTSRICQTSPIVSVLAEHEDLDVSRYRKVLERLIVGVKDHTEDSTTIEEASAADRDATIINFLRRDGYGQQGLPRSITSTIDDMNKENKSNKKRRRTARQANVSHREINDRVASSELISEFLDDLEIAVDQRNSSSFARKTVTIESDEIEDIQKKVMVQDGDKGFLDEKEYSNALQEWVISSSPFAVSSVADNQSGTKSQQIKFLHYYDGKARSQNLLSSGKTLVKEARRCHRMLPAPHANSSVFVCFAEERMDLCRAIVTGPVDTPYSLGIFVFDIFFPPTYPDVPPMVTFMTTGGGQVRFNPNLYVDGKVCLSLLGLTHADDNSERWNPKLSSLGQILLSIQSQIFGVKDPYFNQGSGIPEHMKRTAAGKESSAKHNTMIRLATLRHAVVAQIQSPPGGFEEVTRRHFSLCRRRLVAQARRWMLEAKGQRLFPRFQKVYAELLTLCSKRSSEWILERYNLTSLPPLNDDMRWLKNVDPSFPQTLKIRDREADDKKPAARAMTDPEVTETTKNGAAYAVSANREIPEREVTKAASDDVVDDYNPWAKADATTNTSKPKEDKSSDANGVDGDPDDELYS